MSLYRRDRIWHYDFWYRGNRYRGSTGQASRTRAKRVEALLMLQAREKQGVIRTSRVPSLSEFALAFSVGSRFPCLNLQPNAITNTAGACCE